MPEPREEYAATSHQPSRPSEMEAGPGPRRLLEEPVHSLSPPKLFKTDVLSLGVESPLKSDRHVEKRSWEYVVRSGTAGGLAGCAAKTIVGPLDRVKILFQASNPKFQKYSGSWFGVVTAMRDINKSEGTRGLFRGHSATLLRVFPYAGIKFLAYEQIRAVLIPEKSKETPLRRFVSGSLAGITSVFFTYPLEIIRVRLAFETKRDSRSSLSRICRQIYNEHPPAPAPIASSDGVVATAQAVTQRVTMRSGISNFYRGFAPTLLGMIPYAGMSFLTHDLFGDLFRHPAIASYTVIPSTVTRTDSSNPKAPYRKAQLTAPAQLTAGAMAGLISQTASYPLEIIRRHMQVSGAIGDGHRLSIKETAKKIYLDRGIRGFFVGLTIGYVKVVPMVATSFYVYERMKWVFGIDH